MLEIMRTAKTFSERDATVPRISEIACAEKPSPPCSPRDGQAQKSFGFQKIPDVFGNLLSANRR